MLGSCPVPGASRKAFFCDFIPEWLAEGCAVLGCGGGGATYAAFLMARDAIRKGQRIRVVSADYLLKGDTPSTDKEHEDWVMPCGFMGSPSVSSERIPSGQEIPTACISSMRFLGVSKGHIVAVISCATFTSLCVLRPLMLTTVNQ